jgi:hypothetical protein
MHIRTDSIILTLMGVLSLAACSTTSTTRYVEPSGANTATLEIFNNTYGEIHVSIFGEASECKNRNVINPLSTFEDKVVRIPAGEELAFDITNTFKKNNDANHTYSCHWTASFFPKAGHAYFTNFYVFENNCVIQVSEKIPAANGDSKRIGVPFSQRTWVKSTSPYSGSCTAIRQIPKPFP